MPVFNAEHYIREAIDSILQQTFTDFEFLIFNDGSTDKSAEIITTYKDHRIRFFNFNENSGYVAHLNRGIDIAKGQYIARMDADDISAPERLEKQVNFLDKNPDIGLCGTWYDIIGDCTQIIKVSSDHDDLKIQLIENSTFGHPSVIMRASILHKYGKHYEIDYMPAEDFKMWVDLSLITKIANLDDVLLHYRVHADQISHYKKEVQNRKIQEVRQLQIERLIGKSLTDEEIKIVYFLFGSPNPTGYDTRFTYNAFRFANRLIRENSERKIYQPFKFHKFIVDRVKYLMYMTDFNSSLLFNDAKRLILDGTSRKAKLIFYIKCLLGWSSPSKGSKYRHFMSGVLHSIRSFK